MSETPHYFNPRPGYHAETRAVPIDRLISIAASMLGPGGTMSHSDVVAYLAGGFGAEFYEAHNAVQAALILVNKDD